MRMPEVKEKAKNLGITVGKMKKVDLIRAVQGAEGNTECFGRTDGHCPNTDCCFMDDCLKVN